MNTAMLKQLDARLFEPHKWFVIDRDQHKLADVLSLDNGLAAITNGDAAAVVGRLAPGVTVIDVDAGGVDGDAITENLVTWLTTRHTWHLVRPSGGGPGRHHVYCVPGPATTALTSYVHHLRATYRQPATKIDHRGAGGASPWLRPLSSPHRLTGATPAPLASPTELAAAAANLRRALAHHNRTPTTQPTTTPKPTARARKANAAAAQQTVALQPLPRRRRDLDPQWASWLTNTANPPTLRGADQSRSAIELAATTALLRTGISADEAWKTVSAATGTAFAKARARGRTWWIRHQWNAAVRSDTTWATANRPPNPSTPNPTTSHEVAHAINAARADLTNLQWTWGPRQRHSILLVAHTLLDRMHREDTLAVPCPLRNIEEDTGLARNTVLAALRLLDSHFGRRLQTFDPTRAEASSHVFELANQYTNSGLSLLEPPRITPTHRHPPGRWASLSPPAHAAWRTLARSIRGLALEEVASASGFTHGPTLRPSTRQSRTTQRVLMELESVGLARKTPTGMWMVAHTGNETAARLAAGAHQRHHSRITSEREHYRSGTWNKWNRARLCVLRANRLRQSQWWISLTAQERDDRARDARRRHRSLTQEEQATRRRFLAHKRHRAGEPSERARHAAWCRTFTTQTQADRSAEWQAWFASLTPHQRASRKRHLDRHRVEWHLPPSWASSAPLARLVGAALPQ